VIVSPATLSSRSIDGAMSEQAHSAALGGSVDGMLAEEVVLPEPAWVKMPARLSFEAAATLPCAGVTAYHALFDATPAAARRHRAGPGHRRRLDLRPPARPGGRRPRDRHVVERGQARARAGDGRGPRSRLQGGAKVGRRGRGVDVVVEVGGPGTFDQSVATLRYGGTMSLLGVLTGTKGEVNTYGIFHRGLRVAGIYVGSVAMFEGWSARWRPARSSRSSTARSASPRPAPRTSTSPAASTSARS
jgi:NADPH:quinone reductase-like Zn-dependent oxidoreductase